MCWCVVWICCMMIGCCWCGLMVMNWLVCFWLFFLCFCWRGKVILYIVFVCFRIVLWIWCCVFRFVFLLVRKVIILRNMIFLMMLCVNGVWILIWWRNVWLFWWYSGKSVLLNISWCILCVLNILLFCWWMFCWVSIWRCLIRCCFRFVWYGFGMLLKKLSIKWWFLMFMSKLWVIGNIWNGWWCGLLLSLLLRIFGVFGFCFVVLGSDEIWKSGGSCFFCCVFWVVIFGWIIGIFIGMIFICGSMIIVMWLRLLKSSILRVCYEWF